MMFLDLFFGITGMLLLLVFLYLFVLAFAALLPERPRGKALPRNKFLIVIPAHNEAGVIGQTLEVIKRVDYPKELWEVIVVADNCTDNTAGIVRSHGVKCMERNEPDKKGKGYVLAWAFERLLSHGDHDAFIVMDADTYITPEFLLVVNAWFLEGAEVVQAYSQVRHPDRSPLEALAFLGFALNRNLRYKGRSRLGWQANLIGPGMCFSRKVIERFGWPAVSNVEDIEFTMFLKLHGVRVVFATDAHVTVEIHGNVRDSRGQRLRWDMGKFQIRNRYLPMLFRRFLETRDISYLDSIMELVLPPFSLFFFMVCGLFFLYLVVDFRGLNMTFYIWAGVMGSLLVYTIMGLISAGAGKKVYASLLYAPFFIAWRWWIVLVEYLRRDRQDRW